MEIDTPVRLKLSSLLRSRLPFVIAVLWVLAFFPTFIDLFHRWVRWDSELAHGIPVMVIFFYLVWKSAPWEQSYGRLDAFHSAPASVLLLSLSWFLAYAINIQIIEQLLLIPLLAAILATVFGWRSVFEQRFLLLFLIFAIPVWGSLNGLLLYGANAVVGELVRFIEMPALIKGSSIYIPYGHILIADGCSGLRYFVIAITLAYLMGYLNGYREKQLAVLIVIAAILGLVTNWLRIFILITIGYYTKMESSLMQDHELFGWALFALICLPAIYFAPVVKRAEPERGPQVSVTLGGLKLILLVVLTAIGPVLALLATLALSSGVQERPVETATRGDIDSMPMMVKAPAGGYTEVTRVDSGIYRQIDRYRREDINDKLVPYLPRLFDNQSWQQYSRQTIDIGTRQVVEAIFQEKNRSLRVAQLQWFVVGDYPTHSPVVAKLLQVPAVIQGQNEFQIITLQLECQTRDCEEARRRLRAKAQDMIRGA